MRQSKVIESDELNGSSLDESEDQPLTEVSPEVALEASTAVNATSNGAGSAPASITTFNEIDDSVNALKILLSAVEKLQKVRQEIGDIKPLVNRMLDGEVMTGEELEQLKLGVGGLFKLVRAYTDHQTALAKAQPARDLLDHLIQSQD